MSLLLEVKSAEYIDAEENIHDREISTSCLKWQMGLLWRDTVQQGQKWKKNLNSSEMMYEYVWKDIFLLYLVICS